MTENKLRDKVAIVTGSGRGIGRMEALELARRGAAVVISDFGKDEDGTFRAERVVAEIRDEGGAAVASTENIAEAQGARRTIDVAVSNFEGLDILVNNAGLRGGNPVTKLTEEQWDAVLNSHLKASYLMIQSAVPEMRNRGGGSIVNTGSEAGLGMIFNSAYATAKEGLAGLTRSIAREQGRFGIRCNIVRPRATAGATGGGDWFAEKLAGEWKPLLDKLGKYWIGERGDARWDKKATPDTIAALVAWLCSPSATHVNGQDFYAGGDEIALVSQPEFRKTIFRDHGWDEASLEGPASLLTSGLENHFAIEDPFGNGD